MARGPTKRSGDSGGASRRLAIEAVRRIDEEGSYANLALPAMLAESDLDQRDRGLVTELVYGATRMRRACDWLVDRFLLTPPPPALRAALRVGAYQLVFTRIPAHAAVSATVAGAAKRNRAPTNAILRRVAESLPVTWPDDGTRLSVPDWMIEVLVADLGRDDAYALFETMNTAPTVNEREDGYVQDPASQWVAEALGAEAGDLVLDLCAAPGGKATAIAAAGARVIAADVRPSRAGLIAANAKRLASEALSVVVADGTAAPFRSGSFDRVLVDAPCSGLGVLRRRADARWRIEPGDVAELARLQSSLLDNAAALVRVGGRLTYSVCTVTTAETLDVARGFEEMHPDFVPEPVTDPRWRRHGNGAMVLAQDHDTDAMAVFNWSRSTVGA